LPQAGGILRIRKLRHSYSAAHLCLVVKIARGFDGYGMPLADLVAEGNVGLVQALARFAPERGFACHLRHVVDPGSDPGARSPQPLPGDLALPVELESPL
jgi:Sigma-70 region 2